MMKTQTLICGLFFSILFFSSCCLGDKVAEYDYLITNNSETTITVEIDANELEANTFESLFTIEAGETRSILMTSGAIVNACQNLSYSEDKINTDLEGMTVMNQDSIVSSRDYLDGNEWMFDQGIYTVTVEQAEF